METPDQPLIQLSTHPALNRLPRGSTPEQRKADKRRLNAATANGWVDGSFTLQQLARLQDTGASIGAVYVNGHRSSEGAQSQFIALDFDDAPDRASIEADARALDCAAIIGETATAGHYRVILPLNELVSDPPFTDYARRVRLCFRGATDRASSVIGQPWFGFRAGTTCVIEGAFLSVEALQALPAPTLQAAPRPREAAPQLTGSVQWDDERAYWWKNVVLPALDGAAPVIRGRGRKYEYRRCPNPAHADKDPSFRISTDKAPDGLPICNCGIQDERDPRGIVASWLGLPDFMTWWKAERAPLVKRPKKSVRRRLEKQAVSDSHYAKPRHITDELPAVEIAKHETLLISAPTGMGKTHAVAEYVKTLTPTASVTAIAPYQLLTLAMGAKFDFPHYKDADGAHQRALGQLPQLVSSVSSLSKFNRRGGTVILDEIEKALDFLSNSNTFRDRQALTEYRALKTLVQSAGQLIGMDANLSSITIRWLETLRADVAVKRYSASGRGSLMLLKGEVEGVYQIGKLLAHRRGPVFAACTSENKASQLFERFEASYRVKKVTRDTSNTPEVKAISTDPEARAKYDLIVYDASWGAGVDVSEAVYAHVCLFDRMPLAPEDALQLFGRVRNARRRYAVLPADSEGYPTPSAAELLADKLTRELWTAEKTGMTPHNSGDYLELAQLWADFEARRRAEVATWRRSFIRRIQSNGFSCCENNAPAPDAFRDEWKTWQKARKAQQWHFVQEAADRAISDEKLDMLRMAGSEITSELKLCNVRFKIERALGVSDVNEQDRDLMNSRHRQRLFRLSDLLIDEVEVLDADRLQAVEGRPIHKRRYGTLDRRTIAALFRLMGHSGTPEQQLLAFVEYFQLQRDAPEVEERYQALISDRALRLFKKLGHQGNNSRTVTGLCRWLLDYFGLKLISRQRRSEGGRCMFYQIDGEVLAYRMFRARRAAQQRLLSKNVQPTLTNTFLDTSWTNSTSKEASASDGETGEGYTSEQGRVAFAERMAMLGFEVSGRLR